ncbi:MAG: hypothetical protein H6843_12305 [Rhodospirillaceae bacterium]|nr:hypothetical protein [Rhodospirillaceae bacterium]
MPEETYNPIGPHYDCVPTAGPGRRIVSSLGGTFRTESSVQQSPIDRARKLAAPKAYIPAGVVTIILVMLFDVVAGLIVSALLLSGVAAFIVFSRNNPVSELLLGPSPTYYLVDVSMHTIRDSRRVQLKDTGIYAKVDIEYKASVTDPARAVELGITDVRDHFSLEIGKKITKIAADGKLDDKLESLRNELKAFAEIGVENAVIRIDHMTIEIQVDGKEAEELRRLSASSLTRAHIEAEHEIRDIERNYYQKLVHDDSALLAELMRPNSDKAALQSVIKKRLDRRDADFRESLEILRAAMEHGVVEGHHLKRDFPQFADALDAALDGLSGRTRQLGARNTAQIAPPEKADGDGANGSGGTA